MKKTIIIAEYNPMHSGHKFHINQAKADTMPEAIICLLSGNFTQRGDIAILDKYVRANLAIAGGADIVIEIPTIFATATSELYAYGAINIIKNLSNTTLSFGSECGDQNKINSLAKILGDEPIELQSKIKDLLSTGISYPTATSEAITALYPELSDILLYPNNSLAVEYTKTINKFAPDIAIHTIKRTPNYNDNQVIGEFISASAIREAVSKESLEEIKPYVDTNTYLNLTHLSNTGDLTDRERIFFYLISYALFLQKAEALHNIYDMVEGLENRILKVSKTSTSYQDLLHNIKSKRYTMARIKRLLLRVLLDITADRMELAKTTKPYATVLAIRQERTDILSELERSGIPTLIKPSDVSKLDENQRILYDIDINANSIFNIITQQNNSIPSPFIKQQLTNVNIYE